MSLYKRGKTWHTDFSVNGQRFRQSLDTSDWREAQAKEKELIAQASDGKLTPSRQEYARLRFSEAADEYLQSRSLELSASSMKKERHGLEHHDAWLRTKRIALERHRPPGANGNS
jgi:hypothetical protein